MVWDLPVPGRSLHDQIAPFGHVGDYGRLGRIGVQHVAQVLGAQMIVQALAFGYGRGPGPRNRRRRKPRL